MKREMDIISEAFTSQRLKKYIRLYDGDEAKVVAHYKANLALAESLYTYAVFPSNPALKSLTSEVTVAIRHISQRGEMVTPDKIVAELTFGFWVTLLNSEYELTLWKGLRLAFPYMPKKDRKRKNVSSPCNALRKLRNRVFHHESICWDLDYISGIHSRLVQVLGWMNQDMPGWLIKRYPCNSPQGAGANALKSLVFAFSSSIICAKSMKHLCISGKSSTFAAWNH